MRSVVVGVVFGLVASLLVGVGPAAAQPGPTCDGLAATIVGTEGDDTLAGGNGADVIVGLGGDDVITGGSGADVICGGDGNDTINGGNSGDRLFGEGGDDVLEGSSGSDFLDGGAGDDTIDGGNGGDSLFGGPGDDALDGSSGSDDLDGGLGFDTLDGGNGTDTCTAGEIATSCETVTDPGPGAVFCDGLVATIVGTEGDDTLTGGNGADVIVGLGGDDVITGGSGADVICGGDGNDTINGGNSSDRVFGEGGDDVLEGSSGSDYLDGGPGNDIIDGGNGGDSLFGGPGNDSLDGHNGSDDLDGGSGDDLIEGGNGSDALDGQAGTDLLDGGNGTDTCDDGETNIDCETETNNGDPADEPALCDDLVATIVGTEADDVIVGTPGDDVIVGLGGDDQIDGAGGDDLICGDDGNDIIDGGTGDDVVDGGDGNDSVLGGLGDDLVDGGPGDDSVDGGDGMDLVEGSAGDDVLVGGLGDDIVAGDLGDDSLDGGQGADLLDGGEGTDSLAGGEGNDRLRGGPGPDTIAGDAGDDVIKGGDGDDTVTAGGGDDVVDAGDGTDNVDGGDGVDICESAETSVSCESDVIPEANPFPPDFVQGVPAPAQVVAATSRAAYPGLEVVIDSAGGITAEDISIDPAVVPIGGPISGAAVGPIVNITIPDAAAAFNSATITLPYDEALLSVGFDEADVEVFTFDEDVDLWLPVTANETIDQVNNTVSVSVEHFSTYTVLALGPDGIEGYFGLDAVTAPVCSAGPAETYAETILADGAIAYWPLGDATDAGPNGLDLTVVNGTTGLPVELGAEPVILGTIDGSVRPYNGHLVTSPIAPGSPLLGDGFTVETWISENIIESDSVVAYSLLDSLGAPAGGLTVLITKGDGSVNLIDVTATFTTGTAAVSQKYGDDDTQAWHIVVTASAGGVRVFINAEEVATASTTPGDLAYTPSATYQAQLASGQQNSIVASESLLYDELALYDRALSAAEVQQHYGLGDSEPGGAGGGGPSSTLDTDADGLTDCEEVEGVIVPSKLTRAFDYEFAPDYTFPFPLPIPIDAFLVQTLPNDADSDDDGLDDGQELTRVSLTSKPLLQSVYPVLWDSGIEFLFVANSDPNDPDTEGDGLNDGLEAAAGTKPYLQDTDGDGLDDFAEVLDGDPDTDPLVPNGNEFAIPGLAPRTLFQPFTLPIDGGGIFEDLAFPSRLSWVDDGVQLDIFASVPVRYNYSEFASDYACIENCAELDAWAAARVADGAGCLPFGIPLGCQDTFEVTSRKIAEIIDAQRIWEPESDVLSAEFIAEEVSNRCLLYSADLDTCGDLNDPDLIETLDAQDPDDLTRYVNFPVVVGVVTRVLLQGRPIVILISVALVLAAILLNNNDAQLLTSGQATEEQVAQAIRQCSLTPNLFATVRAVFGQGGWINGLHPCQGMNIYVVGRDVDIDTTFAPDNSSIKATQTAPPGNAKDPVAHRIAAIEATPAFAIEQYRSNDERKEEGLAQRDWYARPTFAIDDARCVGTPRPYDTDFYQCDEFPNFAMSLSGSTFYNNGSTRAVGLDGAALSILSKELNRREGNQNYQAFTYRCDGVRREPPEARELFLVVPIAGADLAPPSMSICRPPLLGG